MISIDYTRPVHTDEELGEELIEEESSELKLDEELVEEESGDSEEEGPMFLDLGSLQQTKTNEVLEGCMLKEQMIIVLM